MSTILVTISGPADKVDLSVPAETPIASLLPTFLSLGVVEDAGDADTYAVARAGEPPLPVTSTLTECGVVDGTVLHVQPAQPEERTEQVVRKRVPMEEVRREEEQAGLARRAGFPLQRTEAALPEEAMVGERLSGALSAFFSRDSPGLPPAVNPDGSSEWDGPAARPADLTVKRPSSRRERMRLSWSDTSYLRRLDEQIAAPRLRRCATIAVVSPKGGVGKTTVTALLGALLVQIRHERMVAIDTNPDYGSLGPALAPDHRVFVDDLVDLLDHPNLTAAEVDRKLARAFDGLLVVPAPTDPARMARLDKVAYTKVFDRLGTMVSGLVLDCGTGLQEPPAQAAIEAADQIIVVSDAEPSTASLVTEASRMLTRSGPPLYVLVNKMPKRGARLELEMLSRAVPEARALVAMNADAESASRLSAGDFAWERAPRDWQRTMRELAAVMVADWPDLGLAS